MSTDDLTPVERSALFVLLAESRPLKESAELVKLYGVNIRARHRDNLKTLGLIATKKSPHYTHTLTTVGRRWVAEQTRDADYPKGATNLGPLYAVVRAVGRLAERSGVAIETLFDPKTVLEQGPEGDAAGEKETPPTPPSHDAAIENTAWSEADRLLGYALQNIRRLDRAFEQLRADLAGAHDDALEAVEVMAESVTQWVEEAASKRLVTLAAAAGDQVDFDPVEHDSDDDLEEGERAVVRKPAVVRGTGRARVVVVRGEVDAAD